MRGGEAEAKFLLLVPVTETQSRSPCKVGTQIMRAVQSQPEGPTSRITRNNFRVWGEGLGGNLAPHPLPGCPPRPVPSFLRAP